MIRVGPAGWSYADWEGRVYPRRKGRAFHALPYLARFFDCVELNSSFYAPPDPRHAARWAELIADRGDFRLTAKLHQGFTHTALPESEPELDRQAQAFRTALAPLVSRGCLAALLAQFPPGFRHGDPSLRHLARLAARFEDLPRVLELRHGSWFGPEALAAVEAQGWSLAEIDLPRPPPGARDWHPPGDVRPIGPVGYLRLHGRNVASWFDPRADRDAKYDYLYTEGEVQEMIGRARRMAGERDETYVVTNNHFGGQAVANALEILEGLRGEPVAAPSELVQAFPRLVPKTRREGQRELFE